MRHKQYNNSPPSLMNCIGSGDWSDAMRIFGAWIWGALLFVLLWVIIVLLIALDFLPDELRKKW